MGSRQNPTFLLLFLPLLLHLYPSTAQTPPSPATLDPSKSCNGVFLSYNLRETKQIHPFLPNTPARQPFSFAAIARVLNAAAVPFPAWSLHIGLPNGTVLVSASSAVISDGSSFPYIVGQNGSNGVSFSGFPNTDLKTAIETAGDLTQIQASIDLIGTIFGVNAPLPSELSLDNPEFICPPPKSPSRGAKSIHTCCVRDPKFKPNNTSPLSEKFLPRRDGDLTISYDVTQTYGSSYLALVTVENRSPLGRLDNWRLKWEWKRGEFVLKTQGAITTVFDSSDCLYGLQGQFYQKLDFGTVQNCDRSPTFLDLPVSYTNDTKLGMIPFCCRNGTILPAVMDPGKAKSAFQLEVYKMPPDLNRTVLFPPQNWQIAGTNGALNPNYQCGPPVRVSPAEFPDPSGLPTSTVAVASWQVVCNITRPRNLKPRCCVSFSGFYNESVVPCKTCACGCGPGAKRTCSTDTPALLLPSEALLVPFENRTEKAVAWANIKHFNIPNPLPCGDNCGVSVNWHVFTDYSNGWSVRMTLFNWEDIDIPNWFTAIVMPKAYDGFEAVYSFNGSSIGNNTIFMQGFEGLNYLVKENNLKNPRDPGKAQSVISFTKKLTPGINVVGGDGFPSKVFFNGEECSLPDVLPTGGGFGRSNVRGTSILSVVLAAVAFVLMI